LYIKGYKIKTIVTIGDGIAAWCLHHKLKDAVDVEVINISANNFFTPCSHNSTSINCLRGTRPGVSKLGDRIIESMDYFEDFYQNEVPGGVAKGFEYQILEDSTLEKWVRRYPEFSKVEEDVFLEPLIQEKSLFFKCPAYFINPEELKRWLHLNANNIVFKNAFVQGISQKGSRYEVLLPSEVLKADKVVLCTNHLTPLLSNNISKEFEFYLNHSKPVSGSYLELNNASDFGFNFDESFNLAIEKYHFIYRQSENKVQIGSSSKNRDTVEIPDTAKLIEIYEFIDRYTKFKLPTFSDFQQKSGIRFKGYYRLPFWGKIDDRNLFAVCGLYKNAFTYSFQMAQELRDELIS
jgi:hypothetical protein